MFLTYGVMFGSLALVLHPAVNRMCLRCMQDMPKNPGLSVQRNTRLLRLSHVNPYILLALFGFFVLVVSLTQALLNWPDWGIWPASVFFYTWCWSQWVHHRLRPWCPYCRDWGDGGDPEVVPDPDPAETKTA